MIRERTGSAQWAAELAVPLELEVAGPDTLAGRVRGHDVKVVRDGQGCRVQVRTAATLPPGFALSPQRGPGPRDPRGDIVIGDAELDPKLHVEATNPAAAIRILRAPEVREAVLALLSRFPASTVGALTIDVAVPGEPSLDALRVAIRQAVALMDALRVATQREAASLETARREAKEAAVELPAKRFVKKRGAQLRTRGDRVFLRNVSMIGGLAGIALFVAAFVTHGVTSDAAAMTSVLLVVGMYKGLGRANACFRCGARLSPGSSGLESLLIRAERCPNCQAWNE